MVDAVKVERVATQPSTIVIQVMRHVEEKDALGRRTGLFVKGVQQSVFRKALNEVVIPAEIVLPGGNRYGLRAVVSHQGRTTFETRGGHYVAHKKSPSDGLWYVTDDSRVKLGSEEAAKRGLPFLDMAGRLLVRRAISLARRA